MVRSGLQQDVINLYRQGVRNAMSKPAKEAREAFMLHWRYSFRHPALKKRDYAAIEHQLRRLSRTLEMLESPSVNRISVSAEMRDWWASTIAAPSSFPSSSSTSTLTSSSSPSLSPLHSATASRTLYTSTRPSSFSHASPILAAAYHTSLAIKQQQQQQQQGQGNEAPETADIGETALEKGETKGSSEPNKTVGEEGVEPTKKSGDGGKRGDQQWGGKLPGHGGT